MKVGDRVRVNLREDAEPGWTAVEDLDGLNGVVVEINTSAAAHGMEHILVNFDSAETVKDSDAYFYPTELEVI